MGLSLWFLKYFEVFFLIVSFVQHQCFDNPGWRKCKAIFLFIWHGTLKCFGLFLFKIWWNIIFKRCPLGLFSYFHAKNSSFVIIFHFCVGTVLVWDSFSTFFCVLIKWINQEGKNVGEIHSWEKTKTNLMLFF